MACNVWMNAEITEDDVLLLMNGKRKVEENKKLQKRYDES